MQLTLHATRRTRHGASRLVQAMSASSVKTRRAPSRHHRDASVYGHTTTPLHHNEYTPPPKHAAVGAGARVRAGSGALRRHPVEEKLHGGGGSSCLRAGKLLWSIVSFKNSCVRAHLNDNFFFYDTPSIFFLFYFDLHPIGRKVNHPSGILMVDSN